MPTVAGDQEENPKSGQNVFLSSKRHASGPVRAGDWEPGRAYAFFLFTFFVFITFVYFFIGKILDGGLPRAFLGNG
jgi:hypothetical protein